MALARIFVLGVILIAPAASLQSRGDSPLQSDTLPLLRLERLEKLMGQYQTLTENLLAENQELKTQMKEMQRELASVKQQQQQQQFLQLKSACRGGTCLEDAQNPSQHSVKETTSTHGQRGSAKATKQDATSQRQNGLYPAQNGPGDGGSQAVSQPDAVPLKESGLGAVSRAHVLTARSDDFGSVEVEVSRLAQAVTGLTADVQALQTSSTQLQSSTTQLQNDQGSSFVQWGSSTCPGSAQLVYAGVMGGSWFHYYGAASNPLCLTMTPVLQDMKSGVTYTNIYGGEYETYDSNMDKDPVCAVCRTPQQTTIMVPGTNVCSAGWTRQYSGFLMAGYQGHNGASQFICVDSKMESETGGNGNDNGHLLYFTKTQCGSLPCSPYVNNKVMTCVVCSK